MNASMLHPVVVRGFVWLGLWAGWGVGAVFSQSWRSELYPEAWAPPGVAVSFATEKLIQDFSYAGYRAGEVAVPRIHGPIFDAAATPYSADRTGAVDATAAIQSAIQAAQSAGGGVVYLPAGTYRVRPQGTNAYALRIQASNVVLRGAGAGQTFLFCDQPNMRGKTVISLQGPSASGFFASGAASSNLTEDLMGPATVIPVANAGAFSPGDFVVIRSAITDAWITEHNESDWLGKGGSLSGFAYARRVVARNTAAGTVTIDVPTRYYVKTRDNARLIRLSTPPLQECGLEDFSVGNVQIVGSGWAEGDYVDDTKAAYQAHNSWLIQIDRAQHCWVDRVQSYQPAGNTYTCHLPSNGLRLLECRHVTVRDTHFQRPQYGGGGGNGYMYRLQHANDCLLVGSRATFSRHGFVFSHFGSCGNVFHGCTDKDTGRQTGNTGSQTTAGQGSDHHMHFSHSNLIDVCTGDQSWFEARYRPFGSDPKHNLTAAHTVFWNTRGIGSSGGAVVRTEQSRYGYAIGSRGTRSTMSRTTFGGSKCNPADHVEGAGLGDTLEPFSLYEDQRIRRLRIPEVILPGAQTLPFPRNSIELAPVSLTVGRSSAEPGDVEAEWSVASGPAPVGFTAANELVTSAVFTRPGRYEIRLTVSANGRSSAALATVFVEGNVSKGVAALEPVADTYVRSGTAAGDNYGGASTLLIKDDGGANVTRRAFLRFALSPLSGRNVTAARLELRSTAPPQTAAVRTAETVFVASDAWDETTMTWNNQPVAGTVLAVWPISTSGFDACEVTPAVQTELAGDGLLSLGLRVASQPAGEIFSYGSKEGGAARRPRLVVDYALGAQTFGQWIGGHPSLPAGERLPESDPDGDGLINAAEYLLARDPSRADARPALEVRRSGGEWELWFNVWRRIDGGAYFHVEAAPALSGATWAPVHGVVFDEAEFLGDAVIYRARVPVPPQSEHFFRLRFHVP
jgi:hypothetical protein